MCDGTKKFNPWQVRTVKNPLQSDEPMTVDHRRSAKLKDEEENQQLLGYIGRRPGTTTRFLAPINCSKILPLFHSYKCYKIS
jgi:hypothetical protein